MSALEAMMIIAIGILTTVSIAGFVVVATKRG